MNMIELKGVTKRFDGFAALSSLDLTVPQGAVYGLIGPNGAGKTTAIRHITGMLKPDRGVALLSGEPIFENESVKERIFCIPFALAPSAAENCSARIASAAASISSNEYSGQNVLMF